MNGLQNLNQYLHLDVVVVVDVDLDVVGSKALHVWRFNAH